MWHLWLLLYDDCSNWFNFCRFRIDSQIILFVSYISLWSVADFLSPLKQISYKLSPNAFILLLYRIQCYSSPTNYKIPIFSLPNSEINISITYDSIILLFSHSHKFWLESKFKFNLLLHCLTGKGRFRRCSRLFLDFCFIFDYLATRIGFYHKNDYFNPCLLFAWCYFFLMQKNF